MDFPLKPSQEEVNAAVEKAGSGILKYIRTFPTAKSNVLKAIATENEALRVELISVFAGIRLPEGRPKGRSVGDHGSAYVLFATLLEEGSWVGGLLLILLSRAGEAIPKVGP